MQEEDYVSSTGIRQHGGPNSVAGHLGAYLPPRNPAHAAIWEASAEICLHHRLNVGQVGVCKILQGKPNTVRAAAHLGSKGIL